MNTNNNPATLLPIKTRKNRRHALLAAIQQIELIRDAEERYMDNTPDNFCGTESYEVAEDAVSTLDEVIPMLYDVYS